MNYGQYFYSIREVFLSQAVVSNIYPAGTESDDLYCKIDPVKPAHPCSLTRLFSSGSPTSNIPKINNGQFLKRDVDKSN